MLGKTNVTKGHQKKSQKQTHTYQRNEPMFKNAAATVNYPCGKKLDFFLKVICPIKDLNPNAIFLPKPMILFATIHTDSYCLW